MPGPNEDKKLELLNRILKEKCDYPGILKLGKCDSPGTAIEFSLNRYEKKSQYQICFMLRSESETTAWDRVEIDCIRKIYAELPASLKAHLVNYRHRLGNISFDESIPMVVLEQALEAEYSPLRMFKAKIEVAAPPPDAGIAKRVTP